MPSAAHNPESTTVPQRVKGQLHPSHAVQGPSVRHHQDSTIIRTLMELGEPWTTQVLSTSKPYCPSQRTSTIQRSVTKKLGMLGIPINTRKAETGEFSQVDSQSKYQIGQSYTNSVKEQKAKKDMMRND